MKHNNIFGDFIKRTAVLLSALFVIAATAWAGSTPAVQVETCEGGAGFIHVKGWAYDPDNQDYSLYVAISVYDKPNYNKLDTYLIKADIARTDVSALNGIPGNHGFETDIPLSAGTYYILFTVFNRNNEVKREVFIDNVAVTAPLTGTVTLTSQSGIITLGNGATLTGTGGENTHVSIVDGATVTLSGVNISAIPDDRNHEWAGITCLGDATIILADETTNTVKSGYSFFAGIQVGPPGKTLTIRGNGSLLAQANGSCFGAGIGSSVFDASNDYDCGNIVIEGGNITAYGNGSPAIGAAQGSPCGTITVKGGTVYAESWGQASGIGSCGTKCGGIAITGGTVTAKSKYGPAIGSSSTNGTCGNITISGGSVTATKGSSSRYSIGAKNNNCSCGTITIGGAVVDGVTVETFVYNSETTIYHVSFSKNANSATGTMADEIFFSSTAQPLSLCSFSLTGYNYLGWNTEADGSGTSYSDGQSITVTNDMTLFAQWGKIYTVTFNANKGSGSMAAQAYTESISQDLTANTFTRTGYDFAGWNTQADGNGTSYSDGQDITLANNMTLYAQWQPHAYNITYNLDAGTNDSSNPATYTIESDAITLADPTRFGFVFNGWTYEGQDTPTKSVTIAQGTYGDLTYTAHWTLNPIATITPETGYAELYDGHTLTGTGGTNTHIVIKDGAIVTLAGATITDIPDDNKHRWSGITCEGDATIILADGTTNNLKGGYWTFPGISVPENKTLTIQGRGTLYLSSNGHGPGIGPDNYGGGEGNITIEGGTIIATGGKNNAGIGGIYDEGNITITDGVTSVTATAGEEAPYSLGSGHGTVTIGGKVIGNILQSPFIYNPSDRTPYTVTFDANGGEDTMEAQNFFMNTPQALNACTFTREGYEFIGWNIKADGTGTNYSDGQTVINLDNVTLYARWIAIGGTKITTDTKEIVLVDGDKIGGTGGTKTHVTIDDGATVTLSGVDITSINNSSSYQWAGITCLGDATIILEDGTTNTVKGGYRSAGIFVPEGHTLTILGDGSLTATGQKYAAGIGSGEEGSCGNIVIEGGNITATGGSNAAGIGCGYGTSSKNSTCGDITITRTVTSVKATKGEDAQHSIGEGKNYSVCGTVAIGWATGPISESPYTYTPSGSMTSTVHFEANNGTSETMDDWLFTYDGATHTFPPCTFTAPEDMLFTGWNTAADGSGTHYDNGQRFIDIPDMTLYAVWRPFIEEITTNTGALKMYDGQTLTGTGSKDAYITIDDGAIITLSDVTIIGRDPVTNSYSDGAGITCLGDATIILKGGNVVEGGYRSAGIFIPEGKTLTILGDGSLIATGHFYAAGIGGGPKSCGNIIIESGTIIALGRDGAAGIGGGKGTKSTQSSCGDITIKGGAIIATGYEENMSIGSGQYGTCGTITINGNLTDKTIEKTRYITAPDWMGTISVKLAKEGYGTYYTGVLDLVMPAGIKAHIVTASADGGQLTYETIADGNTSNNTVPAKTAVMLQATAADNVQTIDIGIRVPTADPISQTNLLGGSDKVEWTSGVNDGTKYYKLTYDQNGKNLGWYWGKNNGNPILNTSHKAWLALPPTAAAREFLGLPEEEETTSLSEELRVKSEESDNVIYNLAGQKLSRPQKGINIVNGRKVLF